ncbi:hypothetical protein JZ751_000138 [Albula glossodonta]|uniref:Uncharacterized protein n=1 Tax=Albula glossodonta TaxID=121402 RepID=A0A8T2PVA3_9TELE|nr:hypothetical protein JZ751_000138 [Albula glossodonta]
MMGPENATSHLNTMIATPPPSPPLSGSPVPPLGCVPCPAAPPCSPCPSPPPPSSPGYTSGGVTLRALPTRHLAHLDPWRRHSWEPGAVVQGCQQYENRSICPHDSVYGSHGTRVLCAPLGEWRLLNINTGWREIPTLSPYMTSTETPRLHCSRGTLNLLSWPVCDTGLVLYCTGHTAPACAPHPPRIIVSLEDLDPEEMEKVLGVALGPHRGLDPRRAPIIHYSQEPGSLQSLTEEEVGPETQHYSVLEAAISIGGCEWVQCGGLGWGGAASLGGDVVMNGVAGQSTQLQGCSASAPTLCEVQTRAQNRAARPPQRPRSHCYEVQTQYNVGLCVSIFVSDFTHYYPVSFPSLLSSLSHLPLLCSPPSSSFPLFIFLPLSMSHTLSCSSPSLLLTIPPPLFTHSPPLLSFIISPNPSLLPYLPYPHSSLSLLSPLFLFPLHQCYLPPCSPPLLLFSLSVEAGGDSNSVFWGKEERTVGEREDTEEREREEANGSPLERTLSFLRKMAGNRKVREREGRGESGRKRLGKERWGGGVWREKGSLCYSCIKRPLATRQEITGYELSLIDLWGDVPSLWPVLLVYAVRL